MAMRNEIPPNIAPIQASNDESGRPADEYEKPGTSADRSSAVRALSHSSGTSPDPSLFA